MFLFGLLKNLEAHLDKLENNLEKLETSSEGIPSYTMYVIKCIFSITGTIDVTTVTHNV